MKTTSLTNLSLTDGRLLAQELRAIRLELRNLVVVLKEIRGELDPQRGMDDDDESLL